MADDEASGAEDRRREEPDREDQEESRAPAAATAAGGPVRSRFFRIYKPGQGYWTRLGTVIGVGLLIFLIAQFLYQELDARTNLDVVGGQEVFPTYKLSIVGAFVVASAALAWHYLNKPGVVDFLIATESEMKKVNWTSRKDLIGSTKVVIVFMLLIALVLFLYDLIFGWFFFGIRVLHQPPF